MHFALRWCLILKSLAALAGVALFGLSLPPASAQNVRWEKSGFGSTRHHGDRAAEKQGRADWPRVADGEPGTQVHVTFDLRNADVILITGHDFGQTPLLNEARRLAARIGRPRADYILFTGTKTVNTDIELNKYLAQPTRRHTESDLNLSVLTAALQSSALPRPIVLFVRADDADQALLTTPGAAPRTLGEATFFGLNEAPPGARLHFAASIPWYAPLLGLAFAAFFLSGIVTIVVSPWRLAKKRAQSAEPPAVPAPEEVQQRYNKQSPLRLVTTLLPLSFVLLSLLGNPHRLMTAVIYSLPFDPNALDSRAAFYLPLGMAALVGLSYLAFALTNRARVRRGEAPLLPVELPDPDDPPRWTRTWFVLVLGVLWPPLMLLPILLLNGVVPRGPWVHSLPFVLPAILLAALTVGGWLASRAVRTDLPPDDPWHQMVDEVAAQAGVTVRHVVRVQSPALNAYASIFGTVGLTAGLLRKMEPEDVRVIIAHEIGHLRGGHVRRGFVVSLLALAVVWAAWWFGLHAARSRLSDSAYTVLSGPMISIFLLPLGINLLLGRGRRQREAAADRFAVAVTGDPERVIQTLTKLHTLNATPHQLRRSDELLSSHPSLVNCIAAIRASAADPHPRVF
jgi:Zn-dependent protease with chaperone function